MDMMDIDLTVPYLLTHNTLDNMEFKLPNNEAVDTLLKVFNSNIRVHSCILKQHSDFFRAFMDSADKEPAEEGAQFKYEYVTVLDPPVVVTSTGGTRIMTGGWNLVPLKKADPARIPKLPRNSIAIKTEIQETQSFIRLLRAMYGKSQKAVSLATYVGGFEINEIVHLVDMADYFGCLPIACATVDSLLVRDPEITASIALDPIQLLIRAKMMHHDMLFKECVIILAAQPAMNTEIAMLDPDLSAIVLKAREGIRRRLLKVAHTLITSQTACPLPNNRGFNGMGDPLNSAEYYHQIFKNVKDDPNNSSTKQLLMGVFEPLTKNNLKLYRPDRYRQVLMPEEYFLCAEVSDSDLPWKSFNTEPETNPLGPYMNIEGDNGEDAGFDVDPDADDEEQD